MFDQRLRAYLFEQGYVVDCTQGVIDFTPKKLCPFFINGKCVDDMTLEEFQEWERTQPHPLLADEWFYPAEIVPLEAIARAVGIPLEQLRARGRSISLADDGDGAV